MKLKRLRIENFKRFRAPVELNDLAPGLNLIAAANESGKSTLAEAIRCAFFERHRSSAVEHLRPWGDAAATPTVELEFELAGQHCELQKSFLGKKRCVLRMGGQSFDGVAAEDHLASLLGFRFPGKGASSAEHMGIPGLLWIKQGQSQDLTQVVVHASDHLRHALGESLGELAASHGDAVLLAVEKERNELLTPAGGQPRGDYDKALRLSTELTDALAQSQAVIQRYREDVDRLASLRQAHADDAASQPWAALQQQAAAAEKKWAEAQGLGEQLRSQEALLPAGDAQIKAWREQLQAMAREEASLAERERKLQQVSEQLEAAQLQVQGWTPRHAAAVQADADARQQLRLSRLQAAQATQSAQLQQWQAQIQTLAQTLTRAQTQQEKRRDLQAQAAALAISKAQIEALRAADVAVRSGQARLDAVGTGLEFELLPAARVQIAGTPVVSGSQHTVLRRTEIDIEGVGRISVLPGGQDLDALADEAERCRDRLAELLQTLQAASLAAVEERLRLQHQKQAEAQASEELLNALAPQGLEKLQAELATRRAQLDDARAESGALAPTNASDAPLPSVAQAERDEQAARETLASATQALQEARAAGQLALQRQRDAQEELAALRLTLDDVQRSARKTQAHATLTDALAQQSALQQKIDTLAQQVQAVNLPVLQQDVQRLRSSWQQAQAAHQQRANDITRLEVGLETRGALGLEEEAAHTAQDLAAAQRRCADLARRARALDHLLKLLRDKRAALAQRLRAPLQKHLQHYLQILFPGAQIEVGDNLAPGRISRPLAAGMEHGEFEALSVGTREQMGVVSRLAYADLLQAAGKPTLLILDDALVHTDAARLDQMKRVLYDAAQRHQILIFSCHPQAWRDLGVSARDIG